MAKRHWKWTAVTVGLVGATALIAAACSSEKAPSGPQTFTVQVGFEDKTEATLVEAFMPSDLTVNVGDAIIFSRTTAEPHTITFNAPAQIPDPFIGRPDGKLEANPVLFFPAPLTLTAPPPPPGTAPLNLAVSFDGSGILNSGFPNAEKDPYKVTFTKAGKYAYLCLVHPEMKGNVTVNAAGTKYPRTQADYDKDASQILATHKTQAKALFDSAKVAAPAAAADGSRTFSVLAGVGDGDKGNEFPRFIGGEKLTIKAGDKVTWTVEKSVPGTPHTITLLSGAQTPDLIIPDPASPPAGLPKLIVNPAILPPAPIPPAPYAGSGLYNSGLLLAGGPTPQSYTLQFTKAGTYKYLCVVHDVSGMNGTITVQ